MKCKAKREIANPEATFTATGTPATKGECPVCGTGLYRMGWTEMHAGMEPPEVPARARKSKHAPKRKGKLVIVESPAKARTVGRILGKEYSVKASVGHVRDLLRSKLSVDVENDFEPRYRVPNEKRDVVKQLKSEAARSEQVYLATDPDREGEAIAWHLLEAAEIELERAHRVVFHEITEPAVEKAFAAPREIDMNLVDAQQARRILDRLVGYNLSPLLWDKVRSRLSAGRVQSVALRLVVERERAIQNFEPQEYWTLDGEFEHASKPPAFRAKLMHQDGEKPALDSAEAVEAISADLRDLPYKVSLVKRGTRQRKPSAPFTTSTMQQAASQQFAFTARKTMAIAQQLYEGLASNGDESVGLITYMRTDSTQVSDQAIGEVRSAIKQFFGEGYLPKAPKRYSSKTSRAQEAHEAVRPTSVFRTPEKLKGRLSKDQYRLYDLIWRRFVASQMKPAVYDTLRVEIEAASAKHSYLFRVSTSTLSFSGFMEVYGQGNGNGGDDEDELEGIVLPDLEVGDPLNLLELHPEQHFTQPPPRFSDASLIKEMEEHGIGRPSTYAPIISTLRRRGYVIREKRRLFPTEIGEIVNDLLVDHFPYVVDVNFTADLESELDEVASGERDWIEVVRDFYEPFSEQLKKAEAEMPEVKAEPEMLDRMCPECGSPLLIRHGRFGRFIGCSNFPECRHTEPWLEHIGVTCPLDGGEIVRRRTRRGRVFYGCSNYPECEFTSWKEPLPAPCPNCNGLLVAHNRDKAKCLDCETILEKDELELEEDDLA
ncbi:MAG: type I DNA topoisomerase [Anaerolineales bacterium]|nr:type I DNA topoisomerase [Anaerolineales bacterium]